MQTKKGFYDGNRNVSTRLCSNTSSNGLVNREDIVNENHIATNWETFEKYRSRQTKGLQTGYKIIDKALVDLPGLITVMGEPKSFKSTFALGVALENARKGVPVIYVDRENGLQRTRLRMLCYISGLTSGAIKGRHTDEEEQRYQGAKEELKTLPLFYLSGISNVEEVEEKIKEIGNYYKSRILLIVDSLQSIITDFKDRRASVDYWVFSFNDLKNRYDQYLTVMLVSEKNRFAYGQASKSGAKESGGIEYKAELVLDLWPNKNQSCINVECTYNRDGDTGIISQLAKPSNLYNYKLEEVEYIPE